MDSHIVYRGLDVSARAKEIAQTVLESYDPQVFETGIRAIFDQVFNYDDRALAGRLLINEIVRSVPSIEVYLALNARMLRPEIIKFLTDNIVILNNLVKEAEFCNYEGHDYFSAKALCSMYLMKSSFEHAPTETPVLKNLRIATELYWDSDSSAIVALSDVVRCFNQMNQNYYTHASPTIFNAGTKTPQMASCFLVGIEDSLDHMMYTGWGDMGMISRYNGALGLDVTPIRHSAITGTGNSAGVVAWGRVADRAIGYVDQGGRRPGAATAFLAIWHIDILDFIQTPNNYGQDHQNRWKSLHNCVWSFDLFWERCRKNEIWTVFCPNTVKPLRGKYGAEFEEMYLMYERLAVERQAEFEIAEKEFLELRRKVSDDVSLIPDFLVAHDRFIKARKERIVYQQLPAKDVLKMFVEVQLKAGRPYMMNGDAANAKTNHKNIGPINNSNLCVEIVEYSDAKTFATCNLASLNLPRFAKRRVSRELASDASVSDHALMAELADCYDFDTLGVMTRSLVRNLEKVIDKNFYPLDPTKIKQPNELTRPLGIGVSGLDDAFKVLDIAYMSREAGLLNKMIFACMYYNAVSQSVELSKIYGEYHHFRTGSYKRWNDETKTFDTLTGSPMSNGQFQFDLWQDEYLYNLHLGRVQKPYDPADNIPIQPYQWQPELSHNVSWENLRRQVMEHGVRNSLFITVMPTASSASILRNAESIEAHQTNIYVRKVYKGEYTIVNRHLYADLKEIGLMTPKIMQYLFDQRGSLQKLLSFLNENVELCPDGVMTDELSNRVAYLAEKHRGMFEIKMKQYLIMARQRGIYVDQSQSTNAYMLDPTVDERMLYQRLAYNLRLKTHSYYLRNELKTTDSGFNKTITSLAKKTRDVITDVVEGVKEVLCVDGTTDENEATPESPVAMCKMEEGCVSCST